VTNANQPRALSETHQHSSHRSIWQLDRLALEFGEPLFAVPDREPECFAEVVGVCKAEHGSEFGDASDDPVAFRLRHVSILGNGDAADQGPGMAAGYCSSMSSSRCCRSPATSRMVRIIVLSRCLDGRAAERTTPNSSRTSTSCSDSLARPNLPMRIRAGGQRIDESVNVRLLVRENLVHKPIPEFLELGWHPIV
jgi:hypothetical protein